MLNVLSTILPAATNLHCHTFGVNIYLNTSQDTFKSLAAKRWSIGAPQLFIEHITIIWHLTTFIHNVNVNVNEGLQCLVTQCKGDCALQ